MNTIQNYTAVAEKDLNTPTATQKYPLGTVFNICDPAKKTVKKFMYVKASAALTAKKVYAISPSGTAGAELATATPATTTVPTLYGVANTAFTSGHYGFLQVEGETVITSAGATTAGNTGIMANGVTTVTDEAGTAITAKTIGYIKNTLAAAGDATVYLLPFPNRVTV